jgi:hypothetical protein
VNEWFKETPKHTEYDGFYIRHEERKDFL